MIKLFYDLKETFHKEIDNLKKKRTELSEMKNAIQEIEISLTSISSRLDCAEKEITDLEDKSTNLVQAIKRMEK